MSPQPPTTPPTPPTPFSRPAPKGNRIWATGDPEPDDHPHVVTLSGARFHHDAEGWYRCQNGDAPRVPWIYITECYSLVSEDHTECPHRHAAGAT